MTKHTVFLFISNENEKIKWYGNITAPKNIKCLYMSQTENVKSYSENYKILLRENKDLSEWTLQHVHKLKDSIQCRKGTKTLETDL